MTKYVFRLLLLVAAIIALIALFGSLLPRSYEFASEIEIDCPAESVFEELNQLSNWRSWSQWNPAEIEGLTVNYSGPEKGVGSTQTWTDIRGSGKMWITASASPKKIEYELVFANFPKMSSSIELFPQNGSTRVYWQSQGKLPGGPFYGFFAPFFSTQMVGEYETSLSKLKKKLETNQSDSK